ncbi:MAG: hypothetical protein NT023_01375 [Armatimonadetes bacterium]|nr:hypothetical protein [Armatimonadota bacterium]
MGGVSVSSITSAWPTTYTGNSSTAPPYVRTPNLAPNQTAYVQTAGMLNAKLRWVYQDGNTQLAPNPPPIIFIREFSSAGWSYYGAMSDATGSGTADNGKGGQYTSPTSYLGGSSSGSWSTQIDSSSGIINRSVSISANATVNINSYMTQPNNSYLVVGGGYSVQLDTRGVSITSSLGMTYQRNTSVNPPVQKPQTVDSVGSTYAHTLRPSPGGIFYNTITYHATPLGNWSISSYYHWYSRIKDFAYSGYFPPAIPDIGNVYTTADDYSSPERIHIHLIDGTDGVNAENYYFLTFHLKYEDWVKTTSVFHPNNIPPSQPGSDWSVVASFANGTSSTQTIGYGLTQSTQLTEAGTIEQTVVLQATDPIGFANFQQKESITSTTQVTSSITQTVTVVVAPHKRVDVATATTWEARTGICSIWGLNGYVKDTTWTGVKVPNTNGSQILSWGLYESTFIP